jgi:pilus assembly protein CpaF
MFPPLNLERDTTRGTGWINRLLTSHMEREEYQELKFTLHRRLIERVNLEALSLLAPEREQAEIRDAILQLIDEERRALTTDEKTRMVEEVMDEVFGLGPLEALLQDPTISDILVTTPRLVYIERAGKLVAAPVQFKDDAHLLRIIEKIVSRVGRRIDESSPMVDARLPDGSRLNAVIPPVAVDGPLLSIRRFGKTPLKPENLIGNFTLTQEMLDLLRAAVLSRLNIIISGGTGAGKTTLLNILSEFIPETERIVTIEDTAELRLHQVHVARMESRVPNIEGKGGIGIRALVINALRMRPDRIVVGEVRGEEAIDMLQAMNTGHDGSLTTIHANSPRDAVGRLEVMVSMANANIGARAIRQQITSAVNLFVQVARLSDGARRITRITECVGTEGETVSLQDIFTFERTGLNKDGKVTGRFQPCGIRPKFHDQLEAAGHGLPSSTFEQMVEIQ